MSFKIIKSSDGFSLLEALLSVVLLGILAYSASSLYFTGYRSLDEQSNRMLLDSRLRGKMEEILSKDFSLIQSGTESITVNRKSYTLVWTSSSVDLNNDTIPESDAKLVTVFIQGLPGRSLQTIVVDNKGRLGKI